MSFPPRESSITAHDRIVKNYYATTSAKGHNDQFDYATASMGLKRGLGDWFDVKGKSVVDLGSGTGELCWLAIDQNANSVTGVNLSQDEIDCARSQVKAEFVCKDILSYLESLPSESVDRLFAMNILEHLDKDTLVAVLEQSARVLCADGKLIAMVPNATSPYGGMTRYWDITHQLAFTPSSIRQLMRLCGFASAEFREWGPRIHGTVSAIRYLLWQIIRGVIALRLSIETGSPKGLIYSSDMIFRLSKN
ncbi:MAG: class I SAM-dependent methyltransferase [Chromatiaceae bacterium]|nr:class I SAM-dependent methyltransferase [Chromatiaceae bacterium]